MKIALIDCTNQSKSSKVRVQKVKWAIQTAYSKWLNRWGTVRNKYTSPTKYTFQTNFTNSHNLCAKFPKTRTAPAPIKTEKYRTNSHRAVRGSLLHIWSKVWPTPNFGLKRSLISTFSDKLLLIASERVSCKWWLIILCSDWLCCFYSKLKNLWEKFSRKKNKFF